MNSQTEPKPSYLLTASVRDVEIIASSRQGAVRLWTGGLFISHSWHDYDLILKTLVDPILLNKFPQYDNIFLHNRQSDPPMTYSTLVLLALHCCTKFLLAVSQYCIGNEWIAAEVEWALKHRRPFIQCIMDDSRPSDIHSNLEQNKTRLYGSFYTIDFRDNVFEAQRRLSEIIDELLEVYPYGSVYHPHA